MASRDDVTSSDEEKTKVQRPTRGASAFPPSIPHADPKDPISVESSISERTSLAQREPTELTPGVDVGEYVIETTIGGGGGGTVYAARHRVHGERVAIKVLRAELAAVPTMLSRFVREATAINTIGHPNIVNIYEFGHLSASRPYYVMELLDGADLRRLLQQRGRFPPPEALALIEPIGNAIQAAHAAGFIHRDLKASNIFVTEVDGVRTVKLLDFGIAKLLQNGPSQPGLTAPGQRLGTAHYMAPEQIRGEHIDARVDVYAFGVLAYHLLTGHYPFYGNDDHAIALSHLHAPVPRPSASAPVSPAMDAVVLRCLKKRPEERFQSVAEFLDAFRTAVAGDAAAAAESTVAAEGFGIHFEVVISDAECNDDAFEDAGNVLDTAEAYLDERGFAFPLRTSNALLGVRILTDQQTWRVEAAKLVKDLRSLLSRRTAPHPCVRTAVSFDVGPVACRTTSPGAAGDVVGGRLLDEVHHWTERHWL